MTLEMATERGEDTPDAEVIAGRYEVVELVGRGGMGAVYRVRDMRDGRALALKRLTLRKTGRSEALRLFEREYHTLAQLRHPRIIRVYDYGLDGAGAFYTMELLSGADMRELSPLPWRAACKHLRELATSLALLHARRLLHRDVTPRNVRLTADGACKLIDFGALTKMGGDGEVIGTPPCVPPEAVDGKPIDQRLDLYALGCVAYFMLTGRHAYPASDSRQLRTFWARRPEPPSQIAAELGGDGEALPAIPPELDALVMALIALDPMARPGSAGAVIDRLDVILGEQAHEEVSLAESYLTNTPLVGRQGQIEIVRQALSAVQRGRGAALSLTGEAGMGRTRLLSEVELAAKLGGALTLRVQAEEHAQPYGSALELAAQLLLHLPELAEPIAREQLDVLGQLMPELCTQLECGRPAPPGDDPLEWRTRCQRALLALFAQVSRLHPLALLIDDVHRCDEASSNMLATLCHEARTLPLLVVTTIRRGDEAISESALQALEHSTRPLELSALYPRDTRSWLVSIFGDLHTLARLSDFLHARSGGRPAAVMALLHHMLERGDLVYREGTWSLPVEPGELNLPEDPSEVLAERIAGLQTRAYGLAQLLSLRRGVVTIELCQALWDGSDATLGPQLDALVDAQVLVAGATGYYFESEQLRELLLGGIAQDACAGMHLRMAEALLAAPEQTRDLRLSAGLHLLEANDERGSDLVVDAAIELAQRYDNMGSAVRLLEAALVKLQERGEPAARVLAVLAPLGMAAYIVDHKLDRHQPAILDAVDEVLGLALARRLQGLLGRVGALVGLGLGLLRYGLQPKRARPASAMVMFQMGMSAMITLAGKCSVCLDTAGVDALRARIEPFSALPLRSPGGFSYAFCVALRMMTEDRYARTYRHMQALERIVHDPRALKGLPAQARQLWSGGVHYVMGLLESLRGDPRALERAAELDAEGLDVHHLIAAQLRLQYHGFRGEAEEVRQAYDRMETSAIQAGSSWQVETWAPIAVNLFGALWGDLMITKRTMKETERMARGIPTLERYALTSVATYELMRGRPRDCVETYKVAIGDEPPLARIGWSTSRGLMAEAYNQLGEHGRAKALCEEVYAAVEPEDDLYFGMRIQVDAAYAIALASLEHHEEAEAHLQQMLARYEPSQSPLAIGAVHEAWARVCWMRGNRKEFTRHLKQVECHFTALANPALIARFQRLTDIAGSGGGIGAKVAIMREVNAFETALLEVDDPEQAARHILAWLMKRAEGFDGYLFARGWDEPVLLAATSEREPLSDMYTKVHETLRALGNQGDTTNFGTGPATQTRRDGSAAHIFLLSYFDGGQPHGEGALVLSGHRREAPPVRYELLQAAAHQLQRLRGGARPSLIP